MKTRWWTGFALHSTTKSHYCFRGSLHDYIATSLSTPWESALTRAALKSANHCSPLKDSREMTGRGKRKKGVVKEWEREMREFSPSRLHNTTKKSIITKVWKKTFFFLKRKMSHLFPFWIRSQRRWGRARPCPIPLRSDSPSLLRSDPPVDRSCPRRSAQRVSPFPVLRTRVIRPWRRPSQQRSWPSESSPRPETEAPERGNETSAWVNHRDRALTVRLSLSFHTHHVSLKNVCTLFCQQIVFIQ